jgi:hypothetical protein
MFCALKVCEIVIEAPIHHHNKKRKDILPLFFCFKGARKPNVCGCLQKICLRRPRCHFWLFLIIYRPPHQNRYFWTKANSDHFALIILASNLPKFVSHILATLKQIRKEIQVNVTLIISGIITPNLLTLHIFALIIEQK